MPTLDVDAALGSSGSSLVGKSLRPDLRILVASGLMADQIAIRLARDPRLSGLVVDGADASGLALSTGATGGVARGAFFPCGIGGTWRLAWADADLAVHDDVETALVAGDGVVRLLLIAEGAHGARILASEIAHQRGCDTPRHIVARLEAAIPQLIVDARLRLEAGDGGLPLPSVGERTSAAHTRPSLVRALHPRQAVNSLFGLVEPAFAGEIAAARTTRLLLMHTPPPDILDGILTRLARYGRFVSLDAVVRSLREGRAPPAGYVLTFDDGFKQNLGLLDVLDRHACKATFYLATGAIGQRRPLWFMNKASAYLTHKADLKRQDFAGFMSLADRVGLTAEDALQWRFAPTEDEVRLLAARGHGIGVHTVDHPFLTRLSDAEIADQVLGAHKRLIEILDDESLPLDFAYPDGDHDDRVVATLARIGGRSATTIIGGPVGVGSDLLRLPRYGLGDDDEPAYALAKLTRVYKRLKS